MNVDSTSRQGAVDRSDPTAFRTWWSRNVSKIFAERKLWRALKVAGWVVFALYFTGLVTMLTRRASTFPVALAESSDAANAMNVLNRTRWNSNNGFAYYGPLYYRLARTILNFDPVYRIADVANANVRDKASYIALMLTSLLALMLMAVILGAMVGPNWSLGWLTGLFMFAFFSSSELWMDFAVDNHPDLVLSMLIAFATATTIKSLRPILLGKTTFLWMVGAAWGLALLTKVSAVTFFVGALVAIATAAWIGRCVIRAGLTVGLSSLSTYMLVGFPQSLNVRVVLNSMLYVASATLKTFDWVFWKNILMETCALPLLVVVGVVLLSVRRGDNADERTDPPTALLGLALLIPGIAFVSLFWLSYQDHMRHYILPVNAALMVTAVPLLQRGALSGFRRLPLFLKPLLRVAGAVLLVAVVVKGRRLYHHHTTSRIVARFQLQDEAETVQKVVCEFLEAGKNVTADPFVPVDPRKHVVTAPSLGFTRDSLGQLFDAEIFVSSRWYHERFLRANAAPWTLLNLSEADYRQRHDFYTMLEKDSFSDGAGRIWKLRLRTPLGWAIWENSGGAVPLTAIEINQMIAVRDRFSSQVLLDLDFSQVIRRDGRQVVRSISGQEVIVEGPANVVPGPRPGQKALVIQSTLPFTRLTPPPASLFLGKGTFAAWAQITNPKKSSSLLLSANTVSGAPRSIYLERYANGRFAVLFNGQSMTVGEAVVLGGQWHHYVFTWDEGSQYFYIDGHRVGSSTAKAPATPCRTFSLGWVGDNNDESQWPGPLAEVVTLKRPLSAEEVVVLHRIGMHGKPTVPKT